MNYKELPNMLYADEQGNIYDHPYYRMTGFSGNEPADIKKDDIINMPRFSKLFFFPDCPPLGIDPETGQIETVNEINLDGKTQKCLAVSSFLEPGYLRTHLPAADYSNKDYILPMWGYTAVGFKNDEYHVTGFRVEYNHKWDPENYDDTHLLTSIEEYSQHIPDNPLVTHLADCAANNHCFAAKNLFHRRWEAPLPVSRSCNADCLGCLSLQPNDICSSSHNRISFTPKKEDIVSIALNHLEKAEEAIVSFGQGCEGEPLTEYKLIMDSVREIRERTVKGTINLNTNGSWPNRIQQIAEAGLDSIRISINSPRKDFYDTYYRPKGYEFDEVLESIKLARDMGLYTMVNYLVFPGISDQEEEIEALGELIQKTGVNFIHMKNLNIDPQLYMEKMPTTNSPAIGMKNMTEIIRKGYPEVELGYFNQPSSRATAR